MRFGDVAKRRARIWPGATLGWFSAWGWQSTPRFAQARCTDLDKWLLSGADRLEVPLKGPRLVEVEDEPAVREGLTVLLKAWGATVDEFDGLAGLQQWLAQEVIPAPDLLIVDYRLPQGHTGVDALAVLRARWPERTLPAIVVTGSSLGGHEDEATKHDLHLLIKPVPPNKLRAMIAFKLAAR